MADATGLELYNSYSYGANPLKALFFTMDENESLKLL